MKNTELKARKCSRLSITIFAVLTLILVGAVGQARGQWTNGTDISNTNAGNVGIGTASPTAKLHVSASGNVMAKVQSSTAGAEFDVVSNASGAGSWGLGTGWASAGLRNLYLYDNVAGATRMVFDSSGNVGIGTTSPTNLFTSDKVVHISSGTNPHIRITDTSNTVNTFMDSEDTSGNIGTTSNHNFNIFSNNLMRMTVTSGGNVGIGTASPASPAGFAKMMHLFGASNASYVVDGGGSSRAEFGISSSGGWLGTPDNLPLRFATNNVEKMRIDANGTVGIGTPAPNSNYKLDVNGNTNVTGNITATGNISAKYQDVAEWVESSQALRAGTVVVLDQIRSNQVIASSQAYDTRVAGVISSQPGITLGEKGESKVLVSTTGRVKVRVDATSGPIQIGDLLVTSGKDGLAMKSQSINLGGVQIHRPGTLIGKALEPLSTGTGEILVLLSLQ